MWCMTFLVSGTKQREEMKGTLDTFQNGFSSLGGDDNGFSKGEFGFVEILPC